ncbi:hypothetical protein LDENG_00254310 [Lucifuga dentata]|nr:hypothetical protein LDENG_00254310 [Lucifuga dentata]
MISSPPSALSVFTVTSKSITVQWGGHVGASSYKITATPKNSPEPSVFAHFSGNTVIGSVNSLTPDTVYTVQLEAIDNALNVLSSEDTEGKTAPDVPSIEHAYSKQSNSITVEFTEVSGATSYILRAETLNHNFFSQMVVSGSPGTIMQLQPYTEYSLSVMSVNSGGRSQPSYPVEVKTVVEAPIFNTTSPSNSSIIVTWPPVEHAVLYELDVIQQHSNERFKLNTTDTTMTLEHLEAGVTYCIKGTAWDSEGRPGDYVNVCQITRPSSPYITLVQMTPGRSLGIVIFWDGVEGATNYTAQNDNYQNCTTEDSYCFITPVKCGQNNTVSVTAYNYAGPSVPSNPMNYITYPCPPENWVEEPTPGNCSLKWHKAPMTEYYVAFIKRFEGTEVWCNTTETSCQFECLCSNTYLTTVLPYNQAGTSPLAPIRNYTTIPCCPEAVSINLVSTETLKISWTPTRGADMYETSAKTGNAEVIHCNDTAPVCALSDLRCNKVYSVVVTPCSDLQGCNRTCAPHNHETAPCPPEILNMTQINNATVRVLISTPNTPNTNYIIKAIGRTDTQTCHTQSNSCDLTQLPCGASYEVMAVASTAIGQSLPGYSMPLETGPCCPTSVHVEQVTQAMSNVSWSASQGARSYVTSLTSSRGHAQCHTLDTHCIMGCITCGTNYSVSLEAISSTGHASECKYNGFSSSACCPTSIKLYQLTNNSLRVSWRSSVPPPLYNIVDMYGYPYGSPTKVSNYTCNATTTSFCDIFNITCGNIYSVAVAPVGQDRVKVGFCPQKKYSGES